MEATASGEGAGVVAPVGPEEHVGPEELVELVEHVEHVELVELVESAEVVGAGAGGVWDDGLIARRARGGGVPRPGGRDGVSGARVESAVAAGVASSAGDRAAGAQGRAGVRAGGASRGGEAGCRQVPVPSRADGSGYRWVADGGRQATSGGLRGRLDALRELIALSRSRLDGRTLEGAGRVLETADARYRLSGEHTVVALAGATGSGKSSLFNALAGANRSQVGPRRPTTAEPVACVWPGPRPGRKDCWTAWVCPHIVGTPRRTATPS